MNFPTKPLVWPAPARWGITVLSAGISYWLVLVWSNQRYALATTVSVLIHELGHAACLRRFGHPSLIVILGIGGTFTRKDLDLSVSQRLWLVLAGPAVNCVLALLLLDSVDKSGLGKLWCAVNAALGLLNLAPLIFTDGAKFLSLLQQHVSDKLWMRGCVVMALSGVVPSAYLWLNGHSFPRVCFIWLVSWTVFLFLSAGEPVDKEGAETASPFSNAYLSLFVLLYSGMVASCTVAVAIALAP